jgi:hypothetical protein
MKELEQAFRALLGKLGTQTKWCLFIDGLDEFEGNYLDLFELIQECGQSSHTKFCLSSRPLLVFSQVFSHLPSLRLQDLTL